MKPNVAVPVALALRRLRRKIILGAAAFAVVPFAVEVEPIDRDTSFTTFTIGAGVGDYAQVARGCNGEVLRVDSHELADLGFAVEHRRNDFAFGVRASEVYEGGPKTTAGQGWVVNPHVGLEGDRFGVGVGVNLGPDDLTSTPADSDPFLPLTGHLRFGNAGAGTDFRISVGENVPAVTPGGLVDLTLGIPVSDVVRFRAGLTSPAPYDQFGFVLRGQVRPADPFCIEVRGRLGVINGVSESTIGLGLSYTLGH